MVAYLEHNAKGKDWTAITGHQREPIKYVRDLAKSWAILWTNDRKRIRRGTCYVFVYEYKFLKCIIQKGLETEPVWRSPLKKIKLAKAVLDEHFLLQ